MRTVNWFSLRIASSMRTHFIVQSGASGEGLGWVDLDLGSSPGWWADTVATYCQSRMVEHPKSKSTQPSPSPDAPDCTVRVYNFPKVESSGRNISGGDRGEVAAHCQVRLRLRDAAPTQEGDLRAQGQHHEAGRRSVSQGWIRLIAFKGLMSAATFPCIYKI